MKNLLLTIFLAAASPSLFAQGTFNFSNFGSGIDAPITNWDGTRLARGQFIIDTWWAPGVVTDPKMLMELGAPSVFYTNGYYLGGTRFIPGTAAGTVVTVQVRVFEPGGEFPPPIFQLGESALFQVTLTAPPAPPATLKGLTPFGLSPPTTYSPPQFILNTVTRDKLVLAWQPSMAATNFVVQQNPDLTTANWVTLAQRPVLIGPQFKIEIPKPTGTMFFRLVSAP